MKSRVIAEGGRRRLSAFRLLLPPTYSGAMSARWLVVSLTAVAFIATPLLIARGLAAPSDISATELAGRIHNRRTVGWSGYVETAGTLQVPDSESFATLAQLLGENTRATGLVAQRG